MRGKIFLALLVAVLLLLCGCGGDSGSVASPMPSHEVDVLRLDTPTPAPTPVREEVQVYTDLNHASVYLEYSKWYVQPILAVHSGWNAPENLSAEELGRFYISLGDDRRGYSIDDCLGEGEYVLPADRFCATISSYFELSADYLMSLSNYEAETDSFILPADAGTTGFGEVYRIEESGGEIRIRYILYAGMEEYYVSTGSRYELCIQESDDAYRYIASTPINDDQPLPALQAGQSYLNTDIYDLYARRDLTVDALTNEGEYTLVSFSGRWSGLELFNRTSGQVTPVVCWNGNGELVTPPFDQFYYYPRLGEYAFRKDGSVWLTVYRMVNETTGALPDRIYVFRDGEFSCDTYCKPLNNTSVVGTRLNRTGSLYDIIPGRDRVALIFGSSTAAVPEIRVTRIGSDLNLRISGVTAAEDFPLPIAPSQAYTVASISRPDETTVEIRLTLTSAVRRYRLSIRDAIAGALPCVELELITDEVDYPEGW